MDMTEDRPTSVRQALRNPWAVLIALGLWCQGFSFESATISTGFQIRDYFMPAIYVLLWAIAIELGGSLPKIGKRLESLVVAGFILASFHMGDAFGYNRLVFIGNGLLSLQLLYLIRPTSLREKKWATGVSIVHLAIGSQLIVGYDFILVLLATIVLLPQTLFHLEASRYRKYVATTTTGPRWFDYVSVAILMVVFFMLIPQPEMRPVNSSRRINIQGPGPMDDQLEADRSVGNADDTLLFRIEGEGLQYIRLLALNDFDGRRWKLNEWGRQRKPLKNRGPEVPIDNTREREVKIIAPQMITRGFVPSDGVVRYFDGMPHGTYRMESGALAYIRSPGNRTYRYWSTESAPGETLRPRDHQLYTELPEMSPALQAELDRVVGTEQDPLAITNALANYFQSEFDYAVGVPRLSEEAPVDDFVLQAKQGHCERFASAMAVMLRMKGIPSRVVMGYTASESNTIGGYYNVRARHGHAWTEAFIDGRGWITVDATPVGVNGIPQESNPWLTNAYDWVQFVWYSKIVEFDSNAQADVWEAISEGIGTISGEVLGNFRYILVVVILIGLVGLMRHLPWKRWLAGRGDRKDKKQQVRIAQSFYARMLKILAKDRYERPRGMTPREFATWLASHGYPHVEDVELITETFCDVRYGEGDLATDRERAVDAALQRMRSQRHPRPRHA